MKLKTIIDKLEKERQKYIKEFGIEPKVWEIDTGLIHTGEACFSLYGSKKREMAGTIYTNTKNIKIGKIG